MVISSSEQEIFNQHFDSGNLPQGCGEYERCTFKGIDFSHMDLSGYIFIECTFFHCNLSNIRIVKTAFRDVKFEDCKLLGLAFYTCHTIGLEMHFERCNLSHASFHKITLKKSVFRSCRLHEADFTGADMSQSLFDDCDLLNAHFEQTNLEKADFRHAINYTIHPTNNRIRKARFSKQGLAGLLSEFDIEVDE